MQIQDYSRREKGIAGILGFPQNVVVWELERNNLKLLHQMYCSFLFKTKVNYLKFNCWIDLIW